MIPKDNYHHFAESSVLRSADLVLFPELLPPTVCRQTMEGGPLGRDSVSDIVFQLLPSLSDVDYK